MVRYLTVFEIVVSQFLGFITVGGAVTRPTDCNKPHDALRTIENGLARGALLPLPEPVWYGERPFFQVGDRVRAFVGGQVKAVGRVARLRETRHWEYELDTLPNVWFARALLVPDHSEQ